MPQSRYPVQRSGNWPSAYGNWDWNDWFNRWGFPSFFERTLSTGANAPVDVCERENEFIIRMACAGCRPEDIDVTVENDVVRIRGRFPEHFEMGTSGGQAMQGQAGQPSSGQTAQGQAMSGQQQTGRGETCLVRELPSGRFERDITLPMVVDAPSAQANFENGLLFLTLPKARAAQGHRIQISQSGQQSASVSTHQGTSNRSR